MPPEEPVTTPVADTAPVEPTAAPAPAPVPAVGTPSPEIEQLSIRLAQGQQVPPPSVVSSDLGQQQTVQNQAELESIGTGLEQARQQALKIQESLKTLQATPTTPSVTPTTTPTTTTTAVAPTPEQTVQQKIAADVALANSSLDQELTAITSLLNDAAARSDVRTAGIVGAIQTKFSARRQQMAQQNESREKFLGVTGIRSGRSRFAPEIQSGIISAEESAGLRRLSELDAQEQSLIAQAQQANEDRQFGILNQRMGLLQDTRREKEATAQRLFENAVALDNLNIAKAREGRLTITEEEKQEDNNRNTLNFLISSGGIGGLDDADLATWAATVGMPVSALEALRDEANQPQNKIVGSFSDGFGVLKTDKAGVITFERITDAQAGITGVSPTGSSGSGTIRDIGDARDAGIPLSAVELRQTRARIDANEELITLTEKYKGIIEKFGFTNRLFGDKALIGEMESLRSQITAVYKDAKTLGALDAGVIQLVEGLIGINPTSGLLNPLKNFFGGPAKKFVAQVDSLIESANRELARDQERLGITEEPTRVDQSDRDEIQAAFEESFGVTPTEVETEEFNPAAFF